MKTRKNRRSGRTPANYRMVLTILDDGGVDYLKEIVTTTEVSLYGARIRGLRTLKPGWKGTLGELDSGHKVPIRIVWEAPASSRAEFKEAAIEIMAECNFWGQSFPNPDEEPESTLNAAACLAEAVGHLQNSPEFKARSKEEVLKVVWSVLQRQLQISRAPNEAEIAESLQHLGACAQQANASAEFEFDLSASY